MATYKCTEDGGDPSRSVPHWDQAVALYAGSAVLDDPDGESGRGHLLYTLANEECYYFGRCKEGDDSPANVELFRMFNDGQKELKAGNCETVDGLLAEMLPHLLVPLIQGAIRTMFILDEYAVHSAHVEGRAAAFYSALVPLIEDCSPQYGAFLEENMVLGRKNSIGVVRAALERCYDDLAVTCEMVGGLLDAKFTGYVEGGEACGGVEPVPGALRKPNPADFRVPAAPGYTRPGAPASSPVSAQSARSAGGGNTLALAVGLTALCAALVTLCAYVVVRTNKPTDGPRSRASAAGPQSPGTKRVLKFPQEGVPPREMFVGGNNGQSDETASVTSSEDYRSFFAEKEAQLGEIEKQIASDRDIV